MLYPCDYKKYYTVEDLYNESREPGAYGRYLLTDFDAPFWSDYLENHGRYDRLFTRLYRNFKYFEQDPTKPVLNVLYAFNNAVLDHLTINRKKYEELYRINVVPDDSYSVIDNYDITETLEKTTLDDVESVNGARTDSTDRFMGEKTDFRTHTEGAKNDSKSTIHGAIQKTGSETLGARQDSSSYTQGAQNNSSTDKVAPYDSESFYNNRNVLDSIGNRNDSTSTNTGSQSNSSSENIGSYTDTEQISQGARTITDTITEGDHTESESVTKGAQTDTKSATGSEEYTLRRKGNIGVMTSTDVMKKASEFWTEWDFYSYIFGEIAKELLIV